MRVTTAGLAPAEEASAAVCVRAVRHADLPILIDLCAEHAAYECAAFDPSGKAGPLGEALFADSARLHAWIAWDGDHACGYASASREFSTWAARDHLHLDCLFLREPARGRGIGAALLQAVVAQATAQGLREMQWQTPDWNKPAIRFYRRLGARDQAKARFTLALDPDQSSLRRSSPITLGVPT